MNSVTITGHLTDEPDLRHTADERAVCRMRVAVDNGRHPTTYIDVVAFDAQAYSCAEYLAKGRKVGVEGRLALSEWRNSAGHARSRYSVIGRVEFLDHPKRHESAGVDTSAPDPSRALQPELALTA